MEIAYLDFEEFKRRLSRNPEDLDRVFRTLATGIDEAAKAKFRAGNIDEKLNMLIRRAKELSVIPQYREYRWQDIVVEATRKSKDIPFSHIENIFGHRRDEADLYPVVARYFKREAYDVYSGDKGRISIGGSIPELIAIKEVRRRREVGRWFWKKFRFRKGFKVISVDVKTAPLQLERFYHQATDYQEGSDEVYLATTSWLMLQEGKEKILSKLKPIGVGLIHVDATTGNCEVRLGARRGKTFSKREKGKVIDLCIKSRGIRY